VPEGVFTPSGLVELLDNADFEQFFAFFCYFGAGLDSLP
jgi:hypothetical protein